MCGAEGGLTVIYPRIQGHRDTGIQDFLLGDNDESPPLAHGRPVFLI